MIFAGLPYSILHMTEKVMANMSRTSLAAWVQLILVYVHNGWLFKR